MINKWNETLGVNLSDIMVEVANRMVGMNLDKAKGLASQHNLRLRVMIEDNTPMIGTCEVDTDRVNVTVKDNIVKDAWVG